MSAFILIVGVAIGVYIFLYNAFVRGARCRSKVKLHGKTVIITGSNTGIGKTTAVDLAKRGARVILACRDQQRAESALRDITAVRQITQKDLCGLVIIRPCRELNLICCLDRQESGSREVVYMQLDLGSLESVRAFAENFLKSERRLDLLINNAGIVKQGRTKDGLGMMLGVNHIGHFLLTNLLLDRLKQCQPSRVINVSSAAHSFGSVDFEALSAHKALGVGTSNMAVFRVYSDSKLCNVLFTHELAKRLEGTNVTCYSLHPGAINSELSRYSSPFLKVLLMPITLLFFKDTKAGAQTTLHCALQEDLEPLSGRYFSNCAMKKVGAKARDDAVARKLWEVSERLCGLS
ncbi:dehydrogenase/reductase SDR family member 13-like isoform X1 [Paramormyrops kingsleyae]|uniref:dehydrogenase/reductase SDR family member 13-like isoform X1 n=1 Tax=Paramormyrops kingsleyae TaxID=1676925 RepID=UPI000CD603C5|nr:dehydrogenase/reductase SDR family member 13-like isoform X1 [Paramormyrops kingsleyae]